MKKDNMQIKSNITLEDRVNAIEAIIGANFQNGDYTPYYSEIGEIIAVGRYFIEGYELEEGETIHSMYYEDADFRKLIDAFLHNNNPKSTNAPIMNYVREMVKDKLAFVKEQVVYSRPIVDETFSKINEFMEVTIDSFSNFSKLRLDQLTPEMIETSKKVLQKLASSNINLTPETLSKVIREAADYKPDEKSKEIIDEKNKQIVELRKYKALWESRNTSK